MSLNLLKTIRSSLNLLFADLCKIQVFKMFNNIVVFFAFTVLISVNGSPRLGSQHPDIDKTLVEIIENKGYPVEEHLIETKDGYILKAFRIPHGRLCPSGENKEVAWLQHGLLGSASDFTHNTVEKALPYKLADDCYEVWLGNSRGNRYSRAHKSLNPDKDPEFWHFSWNEMGVYDFPAMIDYALDISGQDSLYYIGHSMGSTTFFVGASTHPSYNQKIKAMFGLGPAAFIDQMWSPIKLLAPIANDLEKILALVGANEFLPTSELMEMLGRLTCSETSPIQELCTNIIFLISGYNSPQLNRTQLPIMLQHIPSGSSARAIVHYAQLVNSKSFKQFNHGLKGNLEKYGQETPPLYDLSKISAPVSLHYSSNDVLIAISDALRLADALPNLIGAYKVSDPLFTHLDFAIAIDADTLLYNQIMEIMKQY